MNFQRPRGVLFLCLGILAVLLGSTAEILKPRDDNSHTAAVDAEAVVIRLLQQIRARLGWMPEVARAKWNSGAAITDPVREQHLLKELIREGERQGLSAAETTMFFTAQMAGAKRLQEDCFRRWQAEKRGRFHRVADLKQEIRPAIDRLNRELLQSWAAWRCHPAAKKLRLSHLERISQQYLIGPGLTEQIRQQVLAPLRFEASR